MHTKEPTFMGTSCHCRTCTAAPTGTVMGPDRLWRPSMCSLTRTGQIRRWKRCCRGACRTPIRRASTSCYTMYRTTAHRNLRAPLRQSPNPTTVAHHGALLAVVFKARSSAARPSGTSQAEGLNALLELPSLPQTARRTCRSREALVDYSKSILLTSEEYVHTMEVKAKRKEEALVEAARSREEASRRRSAREMEKQRKEQKKVEKAREARARENFRQQWTTEAIGEAGERMQYLMKNPPPLPPPESRVAPFCGYLLPICKENMAKILAKRRCMKFGGDSTNIEPAIPPPWVHLCDPRYADPQPSNSAEATDARSFHAAAP